MSAAMPMTSRTRPASSTTNTGRTSSTPTATRSSIICRSSPNGGRTSTASARSSAASWCRSRSTGRRSTSCSTSTSRPTRRRPNYLASRAEPVDDIQTSEDVVINAVGRELYELFFRGYTRKQWGLDPSELDKQVTARIPTRTNTDDRYFSDTFQAMPLAWLHRDVREDARPSADRGPHRRRFRASSRTSARDRRPHHLHRTDRRIFRLPLRQAALPEPEVRSPDAGAGAVPGSRGGQLSRPRTCRTRGSASTSI